MTGPRSVTELENGTPEAPTMHEVVCAACPTRVLVRKNSRTQTTIQWLSGTVACPELAGRVRVAGCEALRSSIDDAVARGELRVDA